MKRRDYVFHAAAIPDRGCGRAERRTSARCWTGIFERRRDDGRAVRSQERVLQAPSRHQDGIFDGLMERGYYAPASRPGARRFIASASVGAPVGHIAGVRRRAAARAHAVDAALVRRSSAALIAAFGRFMPARTVPCKDARAGNRVGLRGIPEPRGGRAARARSSARPRCSSGSCPTRWRSAWKDRWSKAFEDLLDEPPPWYHGPARRATFRPYVFGQSAEPDVDRRGERDGLRAARLRRLGLRRRRQLGRRLRRRRRARVLSSIVGPGVPRISDTQIV